MNSDFGADIFDDDPSGAPPKPKDKPPAPAHRTSRRAPARPTPEREDELEFRPEPLPQIRDAEEPEGAADDFGAAGSETRDRVEGGEPRRRRRRRRRDRGDRDAGELEARARPEAGDEAPREPPDEEETDSWGAEWSEEPRAEFGDAEDDSEADEDVRGAEPIGLEDAPDLEQEEARPTFRFEPHGRQGGEPGDRGGRRRRRRGGRGNGGERGERREPEPRGPREGRFQTQEAARAPSWEPTRPATATSTAAQRVAFLFDADALQDQAREHGGEVSYSRLLRQVAHGRPLSRAIAYTAGRARGLGGMGGIETSKLARGGDAPIAIAVDAMAAAPRVDCIVLAPESAAAAPLLRALRSLGIKVETASFQGRSGDDDAVQHHRLGRESIFSP
jgi:hypothetical protein